MSGLAMQAAQRGADWLLALLEPDGSLRGGPALTAYYKAPCALAWSGHEDEGRRALDFVAARFLRPDGDLDGEGVPWFGHFRIYPHAWLAYAAAELGRAEVADRLANFLMTRWNAETGGFRARGEGDEEEIMTTSMAGLACLRTGRMEAAAGVARWLEWMFSAQTDLSRALVHVRHPSTGLVRGDESVFYIVNATQLRQWYFLYGISAAFLAEYAGASGEDRWLRLAHSYLDAAKRCREDVYQTPQSGKIGWGAAWTYRRSRAAEDLARVTAVVDGLRALQCADGSWNTEGVYDPNPPQDLQPRMDITAEFTALLSQMGTITNV